MSIKIGFVKYKNEKEFRGKTLFSVKFEDDNELYRMGDEDNVDDLFPKGQTWDDFQEGDALKVKTTEDRKGNVVVEKAKVLSENDDEYPKRKRGGRGNGGSSRSGRGSSAGRQSGGGSRDGYWEEKQRRDIEVIEPRISFYAALDRATDLVRLLVEAEAIDLPAKTKKAEREEVVRGLVEATASRYYNFAQDVPAFLEGTSHDTDGPESLPDDDEGFGEEDGDDDF